MGKAMPICIKYVSFAVKFKVLKKEWMLNCYTGFFGFFANCEARRDSALPLGWTMRSWFFNEELLPECNAIATQAMGEKESVDVAFLDIQFFSKDD
jgi:hypothetical protein